MIKVEGEINMVHYKSYRIVDGKPRWVVEDGNGNIDKCPAKIDNRRKKRIPKDRKCFLCGKKETYVSKNGKEYWFTYKDEKFLCIDCHNHQDENSGNYWKKINALRRNKKLHKNTTQGKGLRIEQIFVSYLGLDNCNIKKDNFNFNFDLFSSYSGYRIQIMSRKLNSFQWGFSGQNFYNKVKNCDILYFACMDKNYKNMERVYRIPSKYVLGLNSVTFYRYLSPSLSYKWERFRLEENEIKILNDIYHSMKIEDCPMLTDEE